MGVKLGWCDAVNTHASTGGTDMHIPQHDSRVFTYRVAPLLAPVSYPVLVSGGRCWHTRQSVPRDRFDRFALFLPMFDRTTVSPFNHIVRFRA